jgi:hypothetical protein
MIQEHVDPYDKRIGCEEDYVSPPFGLPAAEVSGTSTDVETTSGDTEASVT